MNNAIGDIIKNLRLRAGFDSLGELFRVSDVTVATLSRIESGIQSPSPKTLEKLAPFLNISHEDLMISAGYLNGDDEDLTPTPKEEHLTFYRKVGQLSPESVAILDQQADHLLELESKIVARKNAERKAERAKKNK